MQNLRAVNAAIGTIFPWAYSRRPLPGPGAENLAFLVLALPYVTPIGAGIANKRQFWFETPATYVPHMTGIQGLGGIEAGQWYAQQLANLNNSQG